MRERPNLAHNLVNLIVSKHLKALHFSRQLMSPFLLSPLYLNFRLCSCLQSCGHHLSSAEIVPDFLKGRFSTIEENKNHCLRCKIITFCFRRLAIVSITVEYISESTTPSFQRLRTMAEFRDIKLNKNTPIFDNLHNIHKHWTIHSLHAISG